MDCMHKDSIFIYLLTIIILAILPNVDNTAACPNKIVSLSANHTRQYIRSPNYPQPYPRPSACKWMIEATQGDIIVFQFELFEVEASIFCYKDFLSIIDGHTGFHYELMSMCGSYTKSALHKTSQTSAIIQFQAVTSGDTKPGFIIAYWTEELINAEFGDPDYSAVNYVLIGFSVTLALALIGVFASVYRANARILARRLEEERIVMQRRIDMCYGQVGPTKTSCDIRMSADWTNQNTMRH